MANQPDIIPMAWAANNSTADSIPETTSESGKASWDQGFPVETSLPLSQGGVPPKYGDFNGILKILSQFALFAQAGGQYAWSNALAYGVGSIVLGTDGNLYRAAQESTAVNPVGDASGKWERVVSQSDLASISATAAQAAAAANTAQQTAESAQSAVTTLNGNVVKLSGNQTIAGTKTFSSQISGTITSAGTITTTLPVSKGGTGRDGFANLNGVLTVAETSAGDLTAVATANGALYATSAGGVCKFGTLPIAQGGTGMTGIAITGNSIKLPGGLILKWGTVSAKNTGTNVTFNTTYPFTAAPEVFVTWHPGSAPSEMYVTAAYNVTTTSFTAYGFKPTGTETSAMANCYWFAIGK